MVTPHSVISRGAVTANVLMSANSKRYANDRATRVTLWKREIGSLSSRLAAFAFSTSLCMSTPLSSGRAGRSDGLVGPVEPHRVLDEELVLLPSRDGDVGYVVDQEPVVGHVVGEVGVGPVGAPEHAVGELVHDPAGDWEHVRVRVPLPFDSRRT